MVCSYGPKVLIFVAKCFFVAVSGFLFLALFDDGDPIDGFFPYIVVLGGGLSGERTNAACALFKQGHGSKGVILTGGNSETFVADRKALALECGVEESLLIEWLDTKNSQEEVVAIRDFVRVDGDLSVIVVSDFLHFPRLRFLRDRFDLDERVRFAPSVIGDRHDLVYMLRVLFFCFREPVAYFYSRLVCLFD